MERISHALAQARAQREKLQQHTSARGVGGRAGGPNRHRSVGRAPDRPGLDLRTWFAPAAGAILIGMFGWFILAQDSKQGTGADAVQADADINAGSIARMQANTLATNKLRTDLTRLQARMDVLLESITRLDSKLVDVRELQARVNALTARADPGTVGSKPPATVGLSVAQVAAVPGNEQKTAPSAVKGTDLAAIEVSSAEPLATALGNEKKSGPTATTRDPAVAPDGVVATQQTQTTAKADGPWVINLASVPDKPAADRFARRARSKDVPVETVQATVKGKTYWRVRVPGFASAEDAKAQAGSIETKLRLKGSWVGRR